MRAALALGWLLSACGAGGAASERGAAVVEVPDARPEPGERRASARLPARRSPEPPPAPDPLERWVGDWDGLVNDTVPTRLAVTENGRFRVEAGANLQRAACELHGRFRTDGERIWMDVEQTSCSIVMLGATLERRVIARDERSFEVVSPDGSLVIVYTRRAR